MTFLLSTGRKCGSVRGRCAIDATRATSDVTADISYNSWKRYLPLVEYVRRLCKWIIHEVRISMKYLARNTGRETRRGDDDDDDSDDGGRKSERERTFLHFVSLREHAFERIWESRDTSNDRETSDKKRARTLNSRSNHFTRLLEHRKVASNSCQVDVMSSEIKYSFPSQGFFNSYLNSHPTIITTIVHI